MFRSLVLFLAVVAAVTWWQVRRQNKTATREIDRMAAGAELPADPAARAAAVRRQARRVAGLHIGGTTGVVLGTVPFVALGKDLAALGAWVTVGLLGAGAGAWMVHLRDLLQRHASPAPRTAQPRERRLADYLSPGEVAVQYGMLALPALSVWLGVAVLSGTGEGRTRTIGLFVTAALAVAVVALCAVVQRIALRVAPLASTESELRWEEALRAQAVRDLMAVAMVASWGLGGLTVFGATTDWFTGYPQYFVPLVAVALPVGTAALGRALYAASRPDRLRRSQRSHLPGGATR